jgi:hypothetical protein
MGNDGLTVRRTTMSFVRHRLPELSVSGRSSGRDAEFIPADYIREELHGSWQPSLGAQIACLGGIVLCVFALIVIRAAMFY